MGVNYAYESGIRSFAAPIVFACIYTLLLGLFSYRCYKNPVHVHFAIVVYCVFTIIAYSLRATLASSPAYGENLALLNAEEIMFRVGFLILLYSSHTLVLDLEKQSVPSDRPILDHLVVRFLRSHFVFHLILVAAIALAIASGITSNGLDQEVSPSKELDQAGTILFFVLTVFQAFQTGVYASMELTKEHREMRKSDPFGKKYAVFILLGIALFFLMTETFAMVTINDDDKGSNEHFLYPLVVLPELLAILLYATPGLVPAVCPKPMSFPFSGRISIRMRGGEKEVKA